MRLLNWFFGRRRYTITIKIPKHYLKEMLCFLYLQLQLLFTCFAKPVINIKFSLFVIDLLFDEVNLQIVAMDFFKIKLTD